MRFIKKSCLVQAIRVPIESTTHSNMVQHGKVIGLFASLQFNNFRVTEVKGYEIFTSDRKLNARPGDWIVFDGDFKVYTAEHFAASFEPG